MKERIFLENLFGSYEVNRDGNQIEVISDGKKYIFNIINDTYYFRSMEKI